MKTVITQIIKTIQGEGPTIGYPVTLIRFAGCNLACSYCDTKWALKVPKVDEFQLNDFHTPYEINNMNIVNYLLYLNSFMENNNRILFTGGEPFLHTDFMDEVVSYFKYNKDTQFEIETNGILLSSVENVAFIERRFKSIQLNISPKYDEYADKYNDDFYEVIKHFDNIDINYVFKFIYRQELAYDLLSFIDKFSIRESKLVFSPMTPDLTDPDFTQKFKKSCLETVNFCILNNYRYSPREHVFLFGADRDETI